jgi:G:T-mismatch repair DNA endonuclease (very short patch repair protein)
MTRERLKRFFSIGAFWTGLEETIQKILKNIQKHKAKIQRLEENNLELCRQLERATEKLVEHEQAIRRLENYVSYLDGAAKTDRMYKAADMPRGIGNNGDKPAPPIE